METQIDFVHLLESDMSVNILTCLNDPADVVRAGCVSRLWRRFVITNGLSKQLCMRRVPQLSRIAHITVPDLGTTEEDAVGSSNSSWDILKRDHNVYASLLQAIETSNSFQSNCIDYSVSASSTDHFPGESINNTLTTRDRYLNRPSYWSSKGSTDPDAPETLIYRLKADVCVITEISVQPFQAFFQPGMPIYSAKSVRFRFGHPEKSLEGTVMLELPQEQPADDMIIWTYTSEVYPVAQENCLQKFELPEPALCIGGYLQIELLGRVQRQQTDDLYYICVCHVKILGRPLCPAFDIEILEPSGNFVLQFQPEVYQWMLKSFSEESDTSSPGEEVIEHAGAMGFLLQDFHPGIGPVEWVDNDDDEPFVLH